VALRRHGVRRLTRSGARKGDINRAPISASPGMGVGSGREWTLLIFSLIAPG